MTCAATNLPELPGLADEIFNVDQYRAFAFLREQRPVSMGRYYDGTPIWLVTSYDDVRSVLRDRRFINDVSRQSKIDVPAALGIPPDLRPFFERSLLGVDPPDHTRLRRLVAPCFTPHRVAALRPWIQRTTDQLLDGVSTEDVVDLVDRFAHPLSIAVMSEILGVPAEDRDVWLEWAKNLRPSEAGPTASLANGAPRMVEFARHLIEVNRARPVDGAISVLVQACDNDGNELDEDQLLAMVVGLLGAGHGTTSRFICNAVFALLSNREQLGLLRGNPSLLPAAIEEMLRFIAPVEVATGVRVATTDIALGGVTIPTGDIVQVILAAANRDPRRFPEPDRLLLDRADASHVSFGHGVHVCPGAALARVEAETALAALLARFPKLALAVAPEHVEWHLSFSRGPIRLPVRLQ